MDRFLVENLFGIKGFNIAWYGVIITVGILIGQALAVYRSKKTGIAKDHIYNYALILIPVCIICARAYYVIFKWDSYKDAPLEILAVNKGGLAVYGGVIGGVISAAIYCKIKKISFLSLRRIHRGTQGMASGYILLRILAQSALTYSNAAGLSAFQEKRLSALILHDRLRSDTLFCGRPEDGQPVYSARTSCFSAIITYSGHWRSAPSHRDQKAPDIKGGGSRWVTE
jgi:hypothetical protein